MKKLNPTALVLSLIAGTLLALVCLHAATDSAGQPARFEYASVRWAGRDNTHIIRPNGEAEFVGLELRKVRKPDRVDDRAFYLNVVMNALGKEGFELVAMSNDDVVMKRQVGR